MGQVKRSVISAALLALFAGCNGARILESEKPSVIITTLKTLEFSGDACGTPEGSVLDRFFLVNESRVVRGERLLPDSDQDGVADSEEAALGTDPARPRSGSSGCSDRVLQVLAGERDRCVSSCTAALAAVGNDSNQLIDTDHDTLLDCEEAALGTDRNRADSDGDGLVDALEVRFGTSPLTDNTGRDADRDTVLDLDEVAAGTDPLNSGVPLGAGYTYGPITKFSAGGTACFGYDVHNVDLVPTVSRDNHVCTHILTAMLADPNTLVLRRSCAVVKYTE